MTYPDGYVVNFNYAAGLDDAIGRLTSLSDGTGTLEAYQYLGLGTVVERDHPESGVNLTYISQTGSTGDAGDVYVGLDRFGRVVDQNWYDPATSSSVVDLQYGYDADGRVLSRIDGVNAAFGEMYTYDGLNQLASFARGTVADVGPGVGLLGTSVDSQSWAYDALGNWTGVTTNGTTQTRTTNAQNQYTGVSGSATPTYDADGNMTADETGQQYVYDAWGRLVAVKSAAGATLETNTYDGMSRLVTQTSGGVTTKSYFSAQGQVLEQQVGTQYTTRNVWSPVYVNALVDRDTDTSGTGLTATGAGYQRLWPAQDANWDTVALVDGSGAAVERYVYSPFGAVTVMDGSYGARTSSSYAWTVLFQGMAHDAVSGLDKADRRWYSETLGRWTTTDPLGFEGGDNNFYRAFANNTLTNADSSGLDIYFYYEDPSGLGIGYHINVAVVDSEGRIQAIYSGVGPGGRAVFWQFLPSKSTYNRAAVRIPKDPGYAQVLIVTTEYSSELIQAGDWVQQMQALDKAYGKMSQVPEYDLLGPNSNTYAYNLLKKCKN
ncbi:RHS repeat-associated core domain-containing protein [Fimbriiglobus ruber]|uniref:Rhs family protein n=1 Tax=Fimbriiglobus ruber TaxID=1908690 RepID=A0A225DAB1_9BACT|nr:RHS repeat-associated core domain-containing protein [Fimbriiglobus ruber]OWK38392.1 Rhs family protein [Fimbriiglobus ruber]